MSQTLNVHVRVVDAATNKPTPVRIRIAERDGRYLPPLGRPTEFPVGRNEDVGSHVYLGGKRFAYIDGGAEFPLPTAVPLAVEISKGPAYRPIRETVTLGEGQLSLRLAVRKWAESWADLLAVDSRCHFLTPHSAKLEAAAEGLDFVNLLATVQDYPSHDGHMYQTIPNMTAFSGQAAAVENVFVNTLNVHPALGRLALLNCHRAVFPLTFGHDDETDDWSLSDWCDQCHRKKGLAVWSDAYRSAIAGGEALVNAILGKVDAIEFDAGERATPLLPLWYRLLNAGVQLTPVGGSGKDSNRNALGTARTLTPAGEERTYAEWVEHVRAGRTVVTNGPFLRFFVDELPFPSRFKVGKKPLRLRAIAESIAPFEKLELMANGSVIGAAASAGDVIHSATIEIEHEMPTGGWIAARCRGSMAGAFAHSAPTFVDAEGVPFPRRPEAAAALIREVADVRHWIATVGRFTISKRKDHLLALCDAAMEKLQG